MMSKGQEEKSRDEAKMCVSHRGAVPSLEIGTGTVMIATGPSERVISWRNIVTASSIGRATDS